MDASFFRTEAPVERAVKMADGKEHKLFFKLLDNEQFSQYFTAVKSENAKVRARATPELIAMSVCEPDGKLALTPARAFELKLGVQAKLRDAILSVNEVTEGNG